MRYVGRRPVSHRRSVARFLLLPHGESGQATERNIPVRTFHPVWPSSPLSVSRSEVEGVALPGPDLPDLVSDAHFHRAVQAVDLGADPQTAVLEGDLNQQPSEAQREHQAA